MKCNSPSRRLSSVSSSLVRLDNLVAEEIMIERSRIFAVDVNMSKDELIKAVNINQNTRIPVYKENLDKIVGFIHIKDILKNIENKFTIQDILRTIIFVPPSMKVSEVLMKMKFYRKYAAVVIDEFGGTEGLITMIDIIEEIIGDIEDEHDQEITPKFVRIGESKFEVSGEMELEDFNNRSNVSLPESDYFRSIGGYIFHIIGRVPQKGERIRTDEGIEMFIVDTDDKKINSVIIDTSGYKSEKD